MKRQYVVGLRAREQEFLRLIAAGTCQRAEHASATAYAYAYEHGLMADAGAKR